MAIPRHRTTVAAGVTFVLLAQSLSLIDTPLNHTLGHRSTSPSLSSAALASTPLNRPPVRRTALGLRGVRYIPPNRGRPRNTQATGSRGGNQATGPRGCTQSNQSLPTLTLLVPSDHDGLTTSGHPSFFWHISTPMPMAFVLTESGVAQPLLEQQIQPQEAGTIQMKLPKDLPELVAGREYRWSITLVCNRERPSANPFIQSWIKRVPLKPELTQQLTTAGSDHERALVYAQAGLWYDALAAISTAYTTDPSDQSILEDRFLLLNQVGLNQVAAQERQRLSR